MKAFGIASHKHAWPSRKMSERAVPNVKRLETL
jgi:hypothetical protein